MSNVKTVKATAATPGLYDPREAVDPWDNQGRPKMIVKIEGLEAIPDQPGTFQLSGVAPRDIDWQMLAQAIGMRSIPDELAEKIHKEIWNYDILRILTERVKPA